MFYSPNFGKLLSTVPKNSADPSAMSMRRGSSRGGLLGSDGLPIFDGGQGAQRFADKHASEEQKARKAALAKEAAEKAEAEQAAAEMAAAEQAEAEAAAAEKAAAEQAAAAANARHTVRRQSSGCQQLGSDGLPITAGARAFVPKKQKEPEPEPESRSFFSWGSSDEAPAPAPAPEPAPAPAVELQPTTLEQSAPVVMEAGDELTDSAAGLPANLQIPSFPERVPGEPGMFDLEDMAPIGMIKAGALRAMARGCVKRTLDPTGRYEVHRYGQANQRMRLNAASVFGTTVTDLMTDFKYPLAVTLYMRVLKHAVVLLLVLFACGLFGSYENFVRSGKRNECRGAALSATQELGAVWGLRQCAS